MMNVRPGFVYMFLKQYYVYIYIYIDINKPSHVYNEVGLIVIPNLPHPLHLISQNVNAIQMHIQAHSHCAGLLT